VSIAVRGATGANTGSAAALTLSIAAPTGLAAGDVCFIYATTGSGAAYTTPLPTGFTAAVGNAIVGSNTKGILYYRLCDGTEGTTFAVPITVAESIAAVCIALSGCAKDGPFDPIFPQTSGVASSAATISCNPVTTTQLGSTLVWFGNTSSPSGGAPKTITVPPGFTSAVSQQITTSTTATNEGCTCATQAGVAPGTYTPVGTLSASGTNMGVVIAVGNAPNPPGVI
jgi:hypothetical protein